ncbi:MAG: hypothetical protein R6W70_06600 [bacterium]
MGFGKKISDILKTDISELLKSETAKEIARFMNTDLANIVREKNAKEILQKLQKNSDNLELYHSLARIYVKKDEAERAVKIYEGITRKKLKEKKFEECRKFLSKGIDIVQGNGFMFMLYGDIFMQLEDRRQAVNYYRRALEWHMKKQNTEASLYILQRLYLMGKTDISDKITLISLLMGEKMFDEARKIIKELNVSSMKVRPEKKERLLRYNYMLNKNEASVIDLVSFYVKASSYDEAIKIVRREINRNMSLDGKISLMSKLGLAYQKKNRKKNAAKVYKRMGALLKQNDDMILSRKYFRKAKMLTPEDTEVLMELGEEDTISEYVKKKIESYSGVIDQTEETSEKQDDNKS